MYRHQIVITVIFFMVIVSITKETKEDEVRYRRRRQVPLPPGVDKLIEAASNAGAKFIDLSTDLIIKYIKNINRAVIVKNTLEEGIIIYCRDKNTNYGAVVLVPGESYFFMFKPNFFGRSLYWCNMLTHYYHLSFHAYGGKAPHENNVFEVRCSGVYIKRGDDFYLFSGPEKLRTREEIVQFVNFWNGYKQILNQQQEKKQVTAGDPIMENLQERNTYIPLF